MTKRIFKAAILPALLFAVASTYAVPAAAAGLDFCNGSANCTTGMVKNGSATTVTEVIVKQLDRDGCTKVTKTHKKDMKGGQYGNSFDLLLNKCTYKVSFKTTKGCLGDKVKYITPTNIKKDRTRLVLKGVCGKLWINTGTRSSGS